MPGKVKELLGSNSGSKVSGGQSPQEQRRVSFSEMRLDMQKICDSTCPRRQGLVFQRRRESEGSDGSVNFQWTACLEARGMIVGCSESLPASLDVLSPYFLSRRGPESDLKRSPETPAGVLKLPFPRWKSAHTEAGLQREAIMTGISRKCLPDGLGSDPCERHPARPRSIYVVEKQGIHSQSEDGAEARAQARQLAHNCMALISVQGGRG
ncbi:uncharacterized protein LOC117087727 isoform X2 [Trachypithecus francoisi]|uniref:uncharacterized protein LOC117087727 isoform X2 n=1 Tax=Trachypithecus francoisi TaxID=54180 RepID=UPI00141BC5F8|nr:uncharacterized protein LOC117087727 isoform X2 [Trachypithecus francoisi]